MVYKPATPSGSNKNPVCYYLQTYDAFGIINAEIVRFFIHPDGMIRL